MSRALIALPVLLALLALSGSPRVALADEPAPSGTETDTASDTIPAPDDNGPQDLYDYHVRHAMEYLSDPKRQHMWNYIVAELVRGMNVRPLDAPAWREFGRFEQNDTNSWGRPDSSQLDRARMMFYAAVDRDPTDAETWILLTETYFNEDRMAVALLVAREGLAAVTAAEKTGLAVDQLVALVDILSANKKTVERADTLGMRDLTAVEPTVFMAGYWGVAERGGGFTRRASIDTRATFRNSLVTWMALDEHGIRLPVTPEVTTSEGLTVTPRPEVTGDVTESRLVSRLPLIAVGEAPGRNESVTLTEPRSKKSVQLRFTVFGPATDLSIGFVNSQATYRIGTPVHLVPRLRDAAGNGVYIERIPWSARRIQDENGQPCDEDALTQLERETSWVPHKFFWESHHQTLWANEAERAGVYEVSFIADGQVGTVQVTFEGDAKPIEVPSEPGGIVWTGDADQAIATAKKENIWIMAYVNAQW